MKKIYIYLIVLISSIIAGCEQIGEQDIIVSSESLVTKSYGDKYPIMSVYIKTNDVNPLNAGDYMLDDGTAFFDVAELFASNINKDRNGNPTLFLNDKLANILENGGADTFYCLFRNGDGSLPSCHFGNGDGSLPSCHFGNGDDSLFFCHFERSAQHVVEKSA